MTRTCAECGVSPNSHQLHRSHASTLHNVVCALKLGKPTVSIGYADKNDALMAEMGVARFCQHIERLDLDLLKEQFTQLVADRQRYEQSLRNANCAFRERLRRQDSLLASRFLQLKPVQRSRAAVGKGEYLG